mmetsp:Transcript_10171/g.30605  ORF Transcript_10171/g.30605 Transcript_10171/m.30605 type:complete len:160 (+) Transcript_10171:235-714(+)
MSDDEADEEKHDNTGLFFRDDAISSDDEAAGDGDGDDEPAKDPSKADAQAKRDKAAAAALKDREGKRAWREADHVEQQQAKKRKKVVDSGTEAWDTSDAVELAKARAAAAAAARALSGRAATSARVNTPQRKGGSPTGRPSARAALPGALRRAARVKAL